MLRDIVELALSYIQHLLLLVNIAPAFFPSFYSSPTDVLKVLNLDLDNYLGEGNRGDNFLDITVPDIIPLDIRLQFLLISVMAPLLIYLVGLIALGRKLFYIWYLFTLAATLAFTLGITHVVIRDPWLDSILSDLWGTIFIYGGAGLLLLCSVVIAVTFGVKYCLTSAATEEEPGPDLNATRRSSANPLQSRRGTGTDLHRHSSGFFARDDAIEQALQGGIAARDVEEGADGDLIPKEGESYAQKTDAARIRAHLDSIMQEEVNRINVKHTIERFVSFAVFLVLGLFLVRAVKVPGFLDSFQGSIYSIIFAAGIISLLVSLGFLVWFVMGLLHQGRVYQFHIGVFVRDNFVSSLLLLVSVMYIPAVTNVIIIFNCQDISCPTDMRLPDARSTVSLTSDLVPCEPCLADTVVQQCNATFANAVCAASTGYRVKYDPSVACADVETYFWPASGIILLSFVISTPLLNYILTRTSTEKLERDFPVDPRQVEGYNEEELYFEKVHQSDNVARFIYDPFLKRYKHWRFLFLFQKLLIVVVSVFTFNISIMSSETFSISLSLLIHFLILCYVLLARPFTRKVENLFTIVTQLFLCVTCIVGLTASVGHESPSSVGKAVAVLTYTIPIMSLAIGAMFTFRDDMALEQRRDDRSRKARHQANEIEADSGTLDEDGNNITLQEDRIKSDQLVSEAVHYGEGEEGFNSGIVDGKIVTRGDRAVELLSHRDRHLVVEMRTVAGKAGLAGAYSPLGRHLTYLSKNPLAKQRLAEKEQKQRMLVEEVNTGVGTPARLVPIPEGVTPSPASPSLMYHSPAPPMYNMLEKGALSSSNRTDLPAFTPPVLLPATLNGAASPAGSKGKLTVDQSLRARRNWKRLRVVLLDYTRKQRSKGASVGLGNMTSRKSFFGEGNGGAVDDGDRAAGVIDGVAMKQWDTLLMALLSADKRKQIAADQAKNLAQENEATSQVALAGATARVKNNHMAVANRLTSARTKRKSVVTMSTAEAPGELRTGAAGKRQQMQLRIRLREIYEHHLHKLINTQRAVDFQINRLTIFVLMILFVLFSLCVFVALMASILGIMSSDQGDQYFIRSTDTNSLQSQLIGLDSWDNFTSSCCCLPFANLSASWPYYVMDVEKWVCDIVPTEELTSLRSKGEVDSRFQRTVKERIRRAVLSDGTIASGFSIRPLCGMSFQNNCSLQVNTTAGTVDLIGCNSTIPSSDLDFY